MMARDVSVVVTCLLSLIVALSTSSGSKQELDIIVLLDASRSIASADFTKLKSSVIQLVQNLDLENNHHRLGVLVFIGYVWQTIPFSNSTLTLTTAISNIRQPEGGTGTHNAIYDMINMFNSDGREGAMKVGIVFTDGESNTPYKTTSAAYQAKQNGVQMFAVGVGSGTSRSELFRIASSPTYVLELDDFDTLSTSVTSLADKIVQGKCDAALGFENGKITKYQLSATSAYNLHEANEARINVGSGWSAISGGNRYLQLDLLTQHLVTRYSIQGSMNGWYSKAVALYYSQEKVVWERYISKDGTDTLEGNTDSTTVMSYNLIPPVRAHYLAFVPIAWTGHPSLRLELYGCEARRFIPKNYTVIKGNIEDTQEWHLSESPFIVNSMINIQSTGHVKVEAGVKIIFSSEGGLLVFGTLEANGRSDEPIIFSSQIPGFSEPNRWWGLKVVSLGNLTLKNCNIHDAKYGIKGPLTSIRVRDCHIHHNHIGVDLSSGDTDPRSTRLIGMQSTDNAMCGIKGEQWKDGNNFISLKSCNFTSNGEHALSFQHGKAVLVTEDCGFFDNSYGIYLSTTYADLNMKNCTVASNINSGVFVSNDGHNSGFNIDIENSQFKGNRDGIQIIVENLSQKSRFSIKNSYLSSTERSLLLYGDQLSELVVQLKNNSIISTSSSHYTITLKSHGALNVTFDTNLFKTAQAIFLQGDYLAYSILSHNTFTNLLGNKGLQISGGSCVIKANIFHRCRSHSIIYTQAANTNLNQNIFLNPNAQYDVVVDVSFIEGVRLNASHNYWGSSDKFHVRSRIYDFFYDIDRVIVEVHPFYTTQRLTELSPELDSDLFLFKTHNTIGGILSQSVVLKPGQTFYVYGSLYIPEDYKLTIQEQTVIVFRHHRGIYVKGLLEIQGVKNGTVILTNESPDSPWGGLIINSTKTTIRHMVLQHSNTGLNFKIGNSGDFVVSDSVIKQCDTAVSGLIWADWSLSLHRVQMTGTSKVMMLRNLHRGNTSLALVESAIFGGMYLHSDVEGAHFSVHVNSTKCSGEFKIGSCYNYIMMQVFNSKFISVSGFALLIHGGPLNVLIRNTSVLGSVAIAACSFHSPEPGIIDTRYSEFIHTNGKYAMEIVSFGQPDSPHSFFFINNTLHSNKKNVGLYIDVEHYSSPWRIVVEKNIFSGAGIMFHGSISHASIEQNTFQRASTVLHTNIRCTKKSITTFEQNNVKSGTLTLYSRRNIDVFDVLDNMFNGSTVILKNPNTRMIGNIFLQGQEFDIKFEGKGYADKKINCTLNYWDSKDRKILQRRIYDSSYDENLATISYIPFYGFPDNCSETFYGPHCLPYINVLNVIPSTGPDTGGIQVHIWGHNFPQTNRDIFYCRFDQTVVNGIRMSREHVVCEVPKHAVGEVNVEISSDAQQFTQNQTKFTYYEMCQPGACGDDVTPMHGHCLYGRCMCILPWSGDECNNELKAPVIYLKSETSMVGEDEKYEVQPTLTQGDGAIDWLLIRAPLGMKIDSRTGLISWEKTIGSREPYMITIKASNRIGHSEARLLLTVPISYNVTIDEMITDELLPVPKSVLIKGHVNFFSGISKSLTFVNIRIQNKGSMTSVLASTTPETPDKFEAIYFPKAGDSGLFEVDGRHPSNSEFTAQRSWRVLGMNCVPSYTSKKAYLDTGVVEVRNITTLRNVGVDTVINITATVQGVSWPLSSVVVRAKDVLSSEVSGPLIQLLEPNAELIIDLILTASAPLHGTIGVVFNTTEGTVARVRVALQVTLKNSVLIASTRSLTDSLTRGTQKNFQIHVFNNGKLQVTGLGVNLPSEPRLTVASFSISQHHSSEDRLNLLPNATAILVLTVTSGPSDPLGEFSGSVVLNSDFASVSISYRFYVTSLEKVNVTVRVEDEFSYFASGKPLVSNAIVTLMNPMKGYTETRTTKSGVVVFEGVREDRYTLQATAPGHSSYSAVIIAKPSDSTFSIFLQRVAVTYTWTVTPTTFEDKYIITPDSTFKTQVPMPVVTVEPAIINIIPYEEGKKDVINFNITNHGLIRADNVRFLIPRDHSTLIFTQTIDQIGSVDANTSIIVPVQVKARRRVKRSIGGIYNCMVMWFDYFCGEIRTGGQDITLTTPGRRPSPCQVGRIRGGFSGGAIAWGGGDSLDMWRESRDYSAWGSSTPISVFSPIRNDGSFVGVSEIQPVSPKPCFSLILYIPTTPLSCEGKCAKALIECLLDLPPLAECAKAAYDLYKSKGFMNNVVAGVSFGFSCILKPLKRFIPLATLWSTISCIHGLYSNCKSNRRRRRDTSSELIQGVIDSNLPVHNYLSMIKNIYGGEDMFSVHDNSWVSSFNLALAEGSDAGQFLSQAEITSITAEIEISVAATVQKFLLRWNNTKTAWEDGTLATLGPQDNVISYDVVIEKSEQFRKDTEKAKQRGFDTIFAEFDNAVNVFKANEKKEQDDEGVCAMVRVRIVQELVLTRDAFDARLEIENGEQTALENIAVTINFLPTYGNGTDANSKFSVGNLTLVGITAVDGSGRLERDVSGTAEWLIVPYSTAAVEEDVLYDVGGTLSYTVNGSTFSISLLPDTITVKPNPSLILNYFHEKYVQGDDAMTVNVTEPVVPFTLAVMIHNGAYGVARQLKITSAQPEIIENEKGLLVSFKIIEAKLGTDPVTPSLSINFGDIESFETKTARWLLTCPLKGKFFNYTATFENINPLGDPQLSIMESVGYHQLIHLVRLESTDDEFDDFLVNDVVDKDEMPDMVYDSSNGSLSSPVITTNVTEFKLQKTKIVEDRHYIYVDLTVTVTVTGNKGSPYIYTRLVNNLTRDSIDESLLAVRRNDNKRILVDYNAWQTNYYHDKFYLHVFDVVHLNTSKSVKYSILFGPKGKLIPFAEPDNSKGNSKTICRSPILAPVVPLLFVLPVMAFMLMVS